MEALNKKYDTTLTAWFELNKTDEFARTLLYSEVPSHYKWFENQWKKRVLNSNNVISRIYSVSPSEIERFHLRLLLLNVKGATSFDDLLTVNGKKCKSFKEAAKERELIEDDDEWDKCLDEARFFKMPRLLRQLFVQICYWNNPYDVKALFEKHLDYLIEDYLRSLSREQSINVCLYEFNKYFQLFGKKCEDYGLPKPAELIESEHDFDLNHEEEGKKASEMYAKLNRKQKEAFDKVIEYCDMSFDSSKCIFIDGPGGL